MAVMLAVNATGTLRLSEEGELFGMDLHEHGISAYPEYVISPFASPAGMAHQSVAVEPRAGFTAEPVPRPRTAWASGERFLTDHLTTGSEILGAGRRHKTEIYYGRPSHHNEDRK